MKGKIIKGIAGFYYVHVADDGHTMGTVYECKAKGVFRKDHRKPLVGDDVEMDVLDEAQKKGNIRELLPRHSELIRPAVANVDQALVIFAITKPQPNFNLLDRLRTGGIPYDHGQRSQTRRDRYHSGAASRQDHYGGGSQRCR